MYKNRIAANKSVYLTQNTSLRSGLWASYFQR